MSGAIRKTVLSWASGSPRRRAVPGSATVALAVGSTAVIAYTYVGYPLLIDAVARSRRRRHDVDAPEPGDGDRPTVSVVIPALDEAVVIEQKILDTQKQSYPVEKLEVIVVADGSSDATADIARRLGVRVLFNEERQGKPAAVNRGVAAATGEFVVLTDANCSLRPPAIEAALAAFADDRVAVVSGAKTVHGAGARGSGEGLYWRLESRLKQAESAIGATMGSPGEITVIRRSSFREIPPQIVNDDFYLSCDALRRGHEVRYAVEAVAEEEVSATVAEEFERRTRIAAGTWQTVAAHLSLADPRTGWRAVAFVSHRLLRSVVVPMLLVVLWLSCLTLRRRGRWFSRVAGAQSCFYVAALLGGVRDERLLAIPFQFGLTNAAALRGGWRYVSRRQPVTWKRAARRSWAADAG